MSRNNPPSASRYKISAPQPLPSLDIRSPGNDDRPQAIHTLPTQPTLPVAGEVQRSASPALKHNGESSHGSKGAPSPYRPARSQLRTDGPPIIHTSDLRPPTNNVNSNMPLSPISPMSPVSAIQTGHFNDPFAADRSQRSQLRAQANAAAQQAADVQRAGPATDKLRNVVGAFMSASGQAREDPPVRRPGKSEARRRTQPDEEPWDSEGGEFSEIDSVMRKIRKEWPFIMDSDFSPSSLALSLLSSTPSKSLPSHPDLPSFLSVHASLSGSLQSAVQAHFQTFAASLPAHSSFVSNLGRAQKQIDASRAALKTAREGIKGKGKVELASVRTRERIVREMLQILDFIEDLKMVPEQLETYIAEKKFLQAAFLLVRSLKTINRADIREIGATSDLRQYLQSQESTLADILVEELHNHLYLKTFNSDSRWRAYVLGQHSIPVIGPGEDSNTEGDYSNPSSSTFSRYLASLAVKPNQEPVLNETHSISSLPRRANHNANAASISSIASLTVNGGANHDNLIGEADSLAYMETLLEALTALGRLGSALETTVQRVATEIHALIESTIDEVEERAEQRSEDLNVSVQPQNLLLAERHDLENMPLFVNETLRIVVSLDATGPPKHAVILRDLFWTLYSKLSAVMEGHRVVYEVARWIASRRDFKDVTRTESTLNVPVIEILRPVQQEVRALLRTYVNDESQGSTLDRNALPTINEVLREGKLLRDKQRQIFRFSDTDSRAVTNEIKDIDEALKQNLRSSVPGLINLYGSDTANVMNVNVESEERLSTLGRHRTLIPANPFNVTVLFQPTLAFIHRATSIAPPGFEHEMSQFGTVLEDFVVNVFLPQLDEKVTASFQQAVSGYDAFQLDRRGLVGLEKPPLKSSVRVMALIHSLCAMLQETPFHRENYSRLVVGVIVQYYQQCSTRFKNLVTLPSSDGSLDEPFIALPAVWAQRDDIISTLTQVRAVASADRHETENIEQREVKLEMGFVDDNTPIESQLIGSSRKLEALGDLAQSMRWFIENLLDLQELSDNTSLPTPVSLENGETPRLPLTRAMAQRFEAIVQTYEQLVEMILNTMRLETRCRVICNLGASLRRGDYRLESEALSPDPDVVDLNSTLIEAEDIASRCLSTADKDFLFRGLAPLIDHLFVHAALKIRVVNSTGVKKIKRNILSLQQSLRGLISTHSEGVLVRSMAYWDMYETGPKRMLESIRSSKPMFSFEEYNAMLNLQCKSDSNEAPSPELNTYLIDLHALSMSIEGWDMDQS